MSHYTDHSHSFITSKRLLKANPGFASIAKALIIHTIMPDQHQARRIQHHSEVTPKSVITLLYVNDSLHVCLCSCVVSSASFIRCCIRQTSWWIVCYIVTRQCFKEAFGLRKGSCSKLSTRLTDQRNFKLLLVLSISWTFQTPSFFSIYTVLYSFKLQLLSVPSWDSFASQEFVRVEFNSRTLLETLDHSRSHRKLLRIRRPEVSTTTNAKQKKQNILIVLHWAHRLLSNYSGESFYLIQGQHL